MAEAAAALARAELRLLQEPGPRSGPRLRTSSCNEVYADAAGTPGIQLRAAAPHSTQARMSPPACGGATPGSLQEAAGLHTLQLR